jgi:hypothetical protein
MRDIKITDRMIAAHDRAMGSPEYDEEEPEEDIDSPLFGPISDEEKVRFFKEMEGNFGGMKDTAEILLRIVGDVPAAASAFREWLAEAEQFTRESEQEGYGEDLHPDDDPDHDTLLNHIARNGPWDDEYDPGDLKEHEDFAQDDVHTGETDLW